MSCDARWRPRRAGAAAGAQSRHRRPRIPPRDRCDARKAGARPVDQLAAYLRWHRLQSAESDQQAERRATEARVVVGNAGGSASADAARSRRRDVSADARRRCASRRRHQRRLPVGVPRPGSQRRQRQRADHADAEYRDLRRQNLRDHRRRASHRPQRADRRCRVGHAGDGPEAGIHVHSRRACRQRRHHHVADRLPAVQERHLLHPWSRRAHRARSCGAHRRSQGPENPAAIPGTTSR